MDAVTRRIAPNTEYLTLPDSRIEYRRVGRGDGPTVVLLHEGLGCVAMWKDFPDQLSAACELPVLAFSRAGYGGSSRTTLPRPLDYMEREARDVLPALLHACQVDHYILVGHSDGASIALVNAGAIADPGLLGVVAVAPHVFAESFGIEAIDAAAASFEQGKLRESLARYHGGNVDCAFLGWADAWRDPRFLDWNIEHWLAGISVPILQLQGVDDQYGSVEQLRRIEAASGGPVESVLLEDCAHAPMFEQPAATLARIGAFCRARAAAPGRLG